MSIEFFQTMMGRKFFEADVPRLIKAIESLNQNLEKMASKEEESKKTSEPCEDCKGYEIPGILIPIDFDDRVPSRDGMVFVARCDACSIYRSDVDAAEFLEKKFKWKALKSLDEDDSLDESHRIQARGRNWYRPYFNITLKEALATHHPRAAHSWTTTEGERSTP